MQTEQPADLVCDYCDAPAPVTPYLSVGEPGAPLQLWAGRVSRSDGYPEKAGQVSLVWRRKFGLDLTLEPDQAGSPSWQWLDYGTRSHLGLEFGGAVTPMEVAYRGEEKAVILRGGALGPPDAALSHVIAHVGNMPRVHGSRLLHEPQTHNAWSCGRWEVDTNDWHVTLDHVWRFDEVFSTAKLNESYAVTHILRLARRDGATFTPDEADNILSALTYALSFAVGYWVSMICPVGYDTRGVPAWLNLRAPHAGHAQEGSGWWSSSRPQDLASLVRAVADRWIFPPANDPTRFAIVSAILSNATGFVEQRIITAFAALEHSSWTYEVLDRGIAESKWGRFTGKQRVRRLLNSLQVDPRFSDSPNSERLSDYGRGQGHHDLAETVARVRNTIAHPKPEHDIYAHEGVLLDVLHHTNFWLELAILRRLGYNGEVANRTAPMRYGGDSEPMPWTGTTTSEGDQDPAG